MIQTLCDAPFFRRWLPIQLLVCKWSESGSRVCCYRVEVVDELRQFVIHELILAGTFNSAHAHYSLLRLNCYRLEAGHPNESGRGAFWFRQELAMSVVDYNFSIVCCLTEFGGELCGLDHCSLW